EGVLLLITINSFDCVIETIYIGLFIFYAPEKSKINANSDCEDSSVTEYFRLWANDRNGLICLAFNIGVFAAPFSTMNAKSVIMVHEDQPKLELIYSHSLPFPLVSSLSRQQNEPMDMATLIIVLGVLGNIVSFMAFLAPVPTFHKIYKSKSTEGFQSLPYVIALLSSMLSMYYALLQESVLLLITIKSFGCVIENIYIGLFIFYAPKKFKNAKSVIVVHEDQPKLELIQTVNILLLLNVFGYGLMIVLTTLLTKGDLRRKVVGLICLAFNIGVFAAPFSTMRQVIKIRSVEFMSFLLSFVITLGAIMWFFYGFLVKDFYVAASISFSYIYKNNNIITNLTNHLLIYLFFVLNYTQLPNVLEFFLRISQMILYFLFKNAKSVIVVHEDQSKLELEGVLQLITIYSFGCVIETIYIGLFIFYASKKSKVGVLLLIIINSFGRVIKTFYIGLFIFYAPKKFKIQTVKILLLPNVFGYGLMIVLTTLLTKGDLRRQVVGLICLAFNIGVFAAHFSTMNAKSVIVFHENQPELELV
ncbi:hypothetical protein F8388_001065, partial [Cannabis sativa]